MSFIEIIAIAVALSMDAFAVAVCSGCALPKVRPGHFVRMAGAFGFFQFLMPVIGWYLGRTVHGYIEAWDHWVAFVLLVWIGGNMLFGAFEKDDAGEGSSCEDPTGWRRLIMLSIATSLDALAVGLSFSMLGVEIWTPAILIGIVCAGITAGGLLAGKLLAKAEIFGKRAELIGGVVLILIGMNILREHQALSCVLG